MCNWQKLVGVLVLSAFSFVSLADDCEDAKEWYERAEGLSNNSLERQALYLEKAVSLCENYLDAIKSLGRVYYSLRKLDDAVDMLNKASEIDPLDPVIRHDLGVAYSGTGNHSKAISVMEFALDESKQLAVDEQAEFLRALGWVHSRAGNVDEAFDYFEQSTRLYPSAVAFNSLAWILATCPSEKYCYGAKVVAYAEKAVAFEGEDWNLLDTLAAAYARNGQFDKAVRTQQKSMQLLRETNQKLGISEDMQVAEHRLELYKARKPYNEN